MKLSFLYFLLFTSIIAGESAKEHTDFRELDKTKEHVILIGYVCDSLYKCLDSSEKRLFEKTIEAATRQRIGYQIRLSEAWDKNIGDFYGEYDSIARSPEFSESLKWDIKPREKKKLKKRAKALLKKHGKKKVREYLQPELKKKFNVSKALTKQFLKINQGFQSEKTAGGNPIINPKGIYNSYSMMDIIAKNVKDADFVVVNHLICDPDIYMPLYTMARGGVTTGAVTNSLYNEYQVTGWISLYPFLADDNVFNAYQTVPQNKKISVAAWYMTHELGHFLDRRAEFYDHPNCVSQASTSLDYYSWYKAVQVQKCRLPHKKLKSFIGL